MSRGHFQCARHVRLFSLRFTLHCWMLLLWGGLSGFLNVRIASAASADKFKEFVENPPTIALLVYDQKVVEPGGGGSYFQNLFRWQTNAFLFAHGYENLVAINQETDLTRYPDVVAYFGNRFTRRQGEAFSDWTDTGKPEESRNSVKQGLDVPLNVWAAKILNMGTHLVPIGSIRWSADEFTVTNKIKGTLVKGRLLRDNQDRARMMTVESYSENNPQELIERWTYEYSYERALSLSYLPSQLVASRAKGRFGEVTMIFNIYRIDTSSVTLPLAYFLALETGASVRIGVSNKFLIHNQPDGVIVRLDPWANQQDHRTSNKFYLLVALVLASPLIFFWMYRRKAEPKQ